MSRRCKKFKFVYQKIRGRIGIGLGDIKLLAWLSLFAGTNIVDVITYSVAIGICFLLLKSTWSSIRARKLTLPVASQAFAFGPAIVAGFAIVLLLKFGS